MRISHYPSCSCCGEFHRDAVRLLHRGRVCANCADRDRKQGTCSVCATGGPLESHHVAGRKQAPDTLPVCLSCHRILSQLQYRWHPSWKTEVRPGLFRLQGFIDISHVAAARGGAFGLLHYSELSKYSVWGDLVRLSWCLTAFVQFGLEDSYGPVWDGIFQSFDLSPADCGDVVYPEAFQ